MDLLNGSIKKIYFKYLTASFAGTLISSVYGIVDMAMVGQYQGPEGTAALSVVAPVWSIVYSLGMLAGLGGAVLYATTKGEGEKKNENEYFSASVIIGAVLAAVVWMLMLFFDREMLLLFGADDSLLPLSMEYLRPLRYVLPVIIFSQLCFSFLRNDNAPGLTTLAVLSGGVLNILGDYLLVFVFDLGLYGAGLATAIGTVVTFLVTLIHFFGKKNTLRFIWPKNLFGKTKEILKAGFSPFFVDIAMGILTVIFNRRIMFYFGKDELAVYGVLANITTFVQCCAYSVGSAAQPILSINFGAKKPDRIRKTLKYALLTSVVFGLIWMAAVMGAPNGFIRFFMKPTDSVLAIAPVIMRCYGISFLLLPLNIFSTYYFQSVMKSGTSFVVSVLRGLVISGALICILPMIFGADLIWIAMPVTEVLILMLAGTFIARYMRKLERGQIG